MLFFILHIFFMLPHAPVIIDFSSPRDIENWKVVDDDVMGGRSEGHFHYKPEGYAIFTGQVSLANNGGFSSVQYAFEPIAVREYGSVVIRLKGDGNTYQFRVKGRSDQRYWYVHDFETSGKWQEIELRLYSFRPRYRGEALERPNYGGHNLAAVAFLIAPGQEQEFTLIIDQIILQ